MKTNRSLASPLVAAVVAGLIAAPAAAALPGDTTTTATVTASAVPADRRDALLGDRWRSSEDRAWMVAGDGDGLHILVVERLLQEVLERRPDIVTLNEACVVQYDRLRMDLMQAGYEMTGHFYVKTETNVQCFNMGDGRLQEGNAVLVRGDITNTQDYGFVIGNKLVEGNHGAGRGLSCVTARFSGTDRDVKTCSFHLTAGYPDNNQEAAQQVREIARVFVPEARQKPLILAGDTNIQTLPADPNMATLYSEPLGTGDFGEVEQERACVRDLTCDVFQGGSATYGEKKLDYIFAARQFLHIPVGRSTVIDDVGECPEDDGTLPCSDHSMVYAELQLPRG